MSIDIPPSRVADAMHTDTASLPTGYEEDITAAEHLLEEYVEPHAVDSQADAVETAGVYAAAAFINGTEGAAPLASVQRESSTLEFDVANMSDEARDFWQRALMADPTGRLDQATKSSASFEFGAFGSQTGQGRGHQSR